jgi:phytoene dehydrogenase-like protein
MHTRVIQEQGPSISSSTFDAIVIGAGLGGLLSAAHLLRQGKRVVIIERLTHAGGRFTAKTFQGAQVSTGAVHMVPFGSSGVLSQMLQDLRVPHRFLDADVFGTFHIHGKQYRVRSILGVARFLGVRQFAHLLSLGLRFLRPLSPEERDLPYSEWLARHIKIERNPELVAFFERIARFALSVELSQVRASEVIEITKNMFRYGAPAIVQGGCGALIHALEQYVKSNDGDIRLHCEVVDIRQEQGRVTGIQVRDKTSGDEYTLDAPVVISDIGPRATRGLLHHQRITQAQVLHASTATQGGDEPETFSEAVGLKIHFLSDSSLIPHKGILYCLDTQRIAGIVQPTNHDPSLAPPGKHLLISHQVIQSNNIEEERALALADLRRLFGDAFEQHCRVLTMATYRGEWPVNRLAQGEDVATSMSVQGLYLVGDAVKPSGYLMVEGVAQSVNYALDALDATQETTRSDNAGKHHVLPPPPRRNALRWLWKAPGNANKVFIQGEL